MDSKSKECLEILSQDMCRNSKMFQKGTPQNSLFWSWGLKGTEEREGRWKTEKKIERRLFVILERDQPIFSFSWLSQMQARPH